MVNGDTLQNDTLSCMGIKELDTSATVTLRAKAGSGTRKGLDIIIVCDFSYSMRFDTTGSGLTGLSGKPKLLMMRDGVRRFMDNYLRPDDRVALMRFCKGYQIFPEGEIPRRGWMGTGNYNALTLELTRVTGGNFGTYEPDATIMINGQPYTIDTVLSISRLRLNSGPAADLTGASYIIHGYTTIPQGNLAPNDTVYKDTIFYVSASDTGVLDSFPVSGGTSALNMINSWGMQKLWWQFSHRVNLVACCPTPNVRPNPDTSTIMYYFDDARLPGDWVNWGVHGVDPRVNGSAGTAIWYALWQAIRYSLAHSTSQARPVILFLSDGVDEGSPTSFRQYGLNNYSPFPGLQWPLPPHLSPANIMADTAFGATRTQFHQWMMDSICGKVDLYSILLDVDWTLDTRYLSYVSNMEPGANVDGRTPRGRFFDLKGGGSLDSIYDLIGAKITERVAVPVSGQPMFTDELAAGMHYIPGSLTAGIGNSSKLDLSAGGIQIDSVSASPRTLIKFFIQAMDADVTFEYSYRFSVYLNTGSLNPLSLPINPDAGYSRAYYQRSAGVIDSTSFGTDSIVVLSKVKDLVLSRNASSYDSTDLSGSKYLAYTRTTPVSDTATTLYSLLRVVGSDSVNLSAHNVSAIWSFAPPASWQASGTRTIANVTAANATPYLKVGFDSTRTGPENAYLNISYPNPQRPSVTLTAQRGYTAVMQGSAAVTDSVAISVDDPTGFGLTASREFSGTQEELSRSPNHYFFAFGRTITGYTATGTPIVVWRSINVKWRLTGFDKPFYNTGSRVDLTRPDDTLPSIRMDLTPGNLPLVQQTDSGILIITYTNELGAVKEFSLRILVRDLTEVTQPNASMIFPTEEYLAHKTQPAVLESLFFHYRALELSTGTPRVITIPSNDTAVSLTALLFNYRVTETQFKGEDTAKSWRVGSSIPGKDISGIAATPTLTYTNHFYPRTDQVSITSSIDSSVRITVLWSLGTRRLLTLEPVRGTPLDNVSGPPLKKAVLKLDPNIQFDSVFAVIRDEYQNFIDMADSLFLWNHTNTTGTQYIRISGQNPCQVERLVNSDNFYDLIGRLPAGAVVAGITLSSDITDTATVDMDAQGYKALRIRVLQGYSVRDTQGILYTADVPSNRIIVSRALAAADSMPHFVAEVQPVNPGKPWQPLDGAVWTYKDNRPFLWTDTGKIGMNFTVNPNLPWPLDTLVCTWPAYANRTDSIPPTMYPRNFRDTVIFTVLPAYASKVRVRLAEPISAGDSVPVRVWFLDRNDSIVSTASLRPSDVRVFISDTSVHFDGQNRFTAPAPITFTGDTSFNSLLFTQAGRRWITLRFTMPGGGILPYTDTFMVEPGPARKLQIVFKSTKADCAFDTLSFNPQDNRLNRDYLAVLMDAFNNPITRGADLLQLSWRLTGTLSPQHMTAQEEEMSYNAAGITSVQDGLVFCNYSPTVYDSFFLTVFAPANVTDLITREWIADTALAAGDLSPGAVLKDVFGIDPTGLSDSVRLVRLREKGYASELDGILDYLDLHLSSPVHLTQAAVESLWVEHATTDSPLTVWVGRLASSRERNRFYALLPSDGKANTAFDSTHTRYRIWLKPSPLYLDTRGDPANPPSLETGFLPRIMFNNGVVRLTNKIGVRIGVDSLYVPPASVVRDSAAPVLSKAVFIDNSCVEDPDPRARLNVTEIYFSEPVTQFSASAQLNLFVSKGPAGALDSLFMTDTSVAESVLAITSDFGTANARERGSFAASTGRIMYIKVWLSRNPRSLERLSNAANELRLALLGPSAPVTALDMAGNSGNLLDNRWARILSSKNNTLTVCKVSQITSADLRNSLNYRWDEDNLPLFPWWGTPGLINPYAASNTTPPPGASISIAVYIFDLLGNLVASPQKNKCLGVDLSYEDIFKVQNTNSYIQTKALDYTWLFKEARQKGMSPCGILPAWNGLNNKGRQVAPGGYVVKMVINNHVDPPQELSMKLLMTNAKR